ncbi:MAG: SUMF1/EgtB/PvdO family nonheme iron enzyme [Lentisphaeria bacterium]|nr:SUMF1/EgtB/PvdO family nonheme iron enzyme [Lentisphaeria bacterium]
MQQDDDITQILNGTRPDEPQLSAEELRQFLDLPPGDDISDYHNLTAIGIGGSAAVFSATEPGLNRRVALKVLRPEHRNNPSHIEAFIREARTTAQIDHPNVVPVHRIGIFKDAGIYFTMRRVGGSSLHTLIRHLRENQQEWTRRFTMRRRLEIFIAICQGVAYAHSRGIIHRDLKPGNIMIGEYGEVLIMDWGLAAYRQEKDHDAGGCPLDLEMSKNFPSSTRRISRPGKPVISGTPAFMPPEQALGDDAHIDERSDIYSLGTILYSILTLEPSPFPPDLPTEELLSRVVQGRFLRPRRRSPRLAIPRPLEAIVLKAMARHRRDRYATVPELLQDVRNYLDKYPVSAYSRSHLYHGLMLARRRPLIPSVLLAAMVVAALIFGFTQATARIRTGELLTNARTQFTQAEKYYFYARRLQREIGRLPQSVSPENAAERAQLEQNLLRAQVEFDSFSSQVQEAIHSLDELGLKPDSRVEQETLRLLARLTRREIDFALAIGTIPQLQRRLARMQDRWRQLGPRLFLADPDLVSLIERLGRGEWELQVDAPEGSRCYLRRNTAEDAPGTDWRELPPPWYEDNLPSGSYLLKVCLPDSREQLYPLNPAPLAEHRVEVDLPSGLPADFVLIPRGTFIQGNDDRISYLRQFHLPDFLIQKHEVTIGEYLEFWRSLEDPARREFCRAKYTTAARETRNIWDDQGRIAPPFTADMPVIGISGAAAESYCVWRSHRDGLHFRLPTALEYEKAARGVDGRVYVWGNDFNHLAALLADNPQSADYRFGAPVGTFLLDRSCYGVNDLTGNVREFVRNAGEWSPIYRVAGGSYLTGGEAAMTWLGGSSGGAENDIGFRCAADVPDTGIQYGSNVFYSQPQTEVKEI